MERYRLDYLILQYVIDNLVGLNVTSEESNAFSGSRTKKGMFRTVSQLYRVYYFLSIMVIIKLGTTYQFN